jgi:short-subunit dehydrogenase
MPSDINTGGRIVGKKYRQDNSLQSKKVVVITGASAGVGRAIAAEFAAEGAKLGLLARGAEGLEGARRDVEAAGGVALALPTDVADANQVEAAAESIEHQLGPIDIWINCAMTTIFARFTEINAEEYKRVTEVTYLGYVYGTMAALKRMYPRNRGTIIQVGSALAYRSIPLQSAYCGAKHAIAGFTDSIRTEVIHDRKDINLTMVLLPAMNTPQFDWCKTKMPRHPQPVPPIFEPEIAARAIVWASHHPRREVSVGTPTVLAVWGNKFIPGLLDRYLGASGFDSQQTQEPVSSNRPNNLFEPLPGDHGAHGSFGSRSSKRSIQSWVNRHRLTAAVTAAFIIAATIDNLRN